MANLDITRGRSTALTLTNQTGAQSNPGDVVVIDTAHVDSYVASSSSNTVAPIGIVDEVIGISSNGRIVVSGYARAVKTTGTTSRADYLYASSTSLSASNMPGTTPAVGAFGYVTTGGSGTGTKAYIFDPVVAASGTSVSYASNSNQVDTANTSGASSLVARGDHVHLGVTSLAVSSNTLSGPITLLPEGSIGITKKNATTWAINAVAGAGGGGGSGNYTSGIVWSSGTSMPGSPVTNQRITRTDLGLDFFYDGTRWLTIEIFAIALEPWNITLGTGVTANQSGSYRGPVPPLLGGSDYYLINDTIQFYVNGGTALDGSNKWVGTFVKADSAGSETTISTHTINSGASSAFRTDTQTINALLGTTSFIFSDNWTKTGTPGNLIYFHMFTYRIVAT